MATARALAEKGARLILVARNKGRLDAIAAEIPNALAVPADVTDPEQAVSLVDTAQRAYGRIDILINNAGRAMFSVVEQIDVHEYRELLDLNVIAPLRLMQLVIPLMRSQGGGTILNISSMVTRANIPMIAGYSSTKYALNSLTLTAREELAGDNIRVCLMRPGLVDTEFGNNTSRQEPEALRYSPTGELLPHVHSSESVARQIVQMLEADEFEVDMPNQH